MRPRREQDWLRFHDLVRIMVDAGMKAAGLKPIGAGEEIIARKFPCHDGGSTTDPLHGTPGRRHEPER